MLFKIAIILFMAALLAAGIYVCVRYGFGVLRKKVRAFSSRLLILLTVCGVLLLAAVYCYDYISLALKEVLWTDSVESIRDTVRLFFGTTSVLASVKTLLVSCVMLGVLCCVTFGFSGFIFMPASVCEDDRTVMENGDRGECLGGAFDRAKSFLSYSGFIS